MARVCQFPAEICVTILLKGTFLGCSTSSSLMPNRQFLPTPQPQIQPFSVHTTVKQLPEEMWLHTTFLSSLMRQGTASDLFLPFPRDLFQPIPHTKTYVCCEAFYIIIKMSISKAFGTLKCLAFTYNTFDIGTLDWICKTVTSTEDYDLTLEQELIGLVSAAYELIRKDKQSSSCPETLTLLVISSLLFNIYAKFKKIDSLKLNNSFYNLSQSMEMSEPSMVSIITAEAEMKRFLNLVQRLAGDKNLWKKIQILVECKKNNAAINRRYMYSLLENIESILTKQKLPKESFYETKKIFTQSPDQKLTQQPNQFINDVLFSNQLNKVLELLQGDSLDVGFSLCRIYWTNYDRKKGKPVRKCFANCKYTGKQMLYNLLRHYITSFSRKSDLFTESKNPLSNLMLNYISVLFLPEIQKFAAIVDKCMNRVQDRTDAITFYNRVADIIQKDLIQFIQGLPSQLWQIMSTLCKIINTHKWKDSLDSSIPVKVLFFNRFLFNSRFIDLFFTNYSIADYEKTANLLNQLFFTEALKKYESNPKAKQLILMVCEAFSDGLSYGDNQFEQDKDDQYFIEEPIIKYDYQILGSVITKMDFTPKDQKSFEMTELLEDIKQAEKAELIEREQNSRQNQEIRETREPFAKIYKFEKFNSPIPTSQSLPQEELDYDLYKMSVNWQARKAKNEAPKKKTSSVVKPCISFDPAKKKQVMDSYVQYKLQKFI